MDRLITALIEGDRSGAIAETRRLLDAQVPAERIVTEGLEPAMQRVDDRCTVEAFNLLEIMLVGRAVSGVATELYPQGPPLGQLRATLVIASPQGDVHDLGKNIVAMVLRGKGYRVVDLGRDCPAGTIADAAKREAAEAVLVSGLITTIIPQVRTIRPALEELGLSAVSIVAGGAALMQASAQQLDVDYVAQSAFDGARYLESLVAGRST